MTGWKCSGGLYHGLRATPFPSGNEPARIRIQSTRAQMALVKLQMQMKMVRHTPQISPQPVDLAFSLRLAILTPMQHVAQHERRNERPVSNLKIPATMYPFTMIREINESQRQHLLLSSWSFGQERGNLKFLSVFFCIFFLSIHNELTSKKIFKKVLNYSILLTKNIVFYLTFN